MERNMQAETCAFMLKKERNGMTFRKCLALDKNYCIKCPYDKCKFYMDMDTFKRKTLRYNNKYGKRVLQNEKTK